MVTLAPACPSLALAQREDAKVAAPNLPGDVHHHLNDFFHFALMAANGTGDAVDVDLMARSVLYAGDLLFDLPREKRSGHRATRRAWIAEDFERLSSHDF